MTTATTKIRWTRNESGDYSANYRGVNIDIMRVNYDATGVEGDRGRVWWNIAWNGSIDDAGDTLREAKVMAIKEVDRMVGALDGQAAAEVNLIDRILNA